MRRFRNSASSASHGILNEDDGGFLARGEVFLRVVFYGAVAPAKGGDSGVKIAMAPFHSPTHKQASDWAYWASQKYNRGTTHIFPETYDIFTYRDPYFGRNITVIDIGMGS